MNRLNSDICKRTYTMGMKRIDRKKREAALEYRWFVTTYDPKDEGYCERADVLANEWRMWWKLDDAIRNPRGQR